MIEIITGSLEEHILKILQQTYPVTLEDLEGQLQVKHEVLIRTIKKLQLQGIVSVDPLPGASFIRLLRSDIVFVGKKRQKKFVKHRRFKGTSTTTYSDDDSSMYQ